MVKVDGRKYRNVCVILGWSRVLELTGLFLLSLSPAGCEEQQRVGGERSSWSISLSTPPPLCLSSIQPKQRLCSFSHTMQIVPEDNCLQFPFRPVGGDLGVRRLHSRTKWRSGEQQNIGALDAVSLLVECAEFNLVSVSAGRSTGVLSSIPLQLLLHLTSAYFVLYFVSTLGLIIRKSLLLSYPLDALACDVGLLLLLAALELLHFFCGVKGNLTQSEGFILGNLVATAITILLTVYFLVWQTYVMLADVIISSILLAIYSFDGVLALSTLARFASVYS
ncbi:uncharacterized protein LOC133444886 [Cololabis saira]|uniref:uncharacterized protein LOC133444886 n=1 Tax=Cololabis saira TaxID=129043 RepID=UPI002AD57A54|nr:uncharacterized protein LOC133444886 [Cololabis saira]